jgi:hypothetical protein
VTKLHQLHDRYGQSPWLDNRTRGDVTGGRLRRLASQGIRGVTSNPTIIHKAISGSADYDGQLAVLAARGRTPKPATGRWSATTSTAPWPCCGPLSGRTGQAERVLERLLAVAAPDGLLPEAYDSDTGRWLARHWFAWPGAVLAALALGAADRPTGPPVVPTR